MTRSVELGGPAAPVFPSGKTTHDDHVAFAQILVAKLQESASKERDYDLGSSDDAGHITVPLVALEPDGDRVVVAPRKSLDDESPAAAAAATAAAVAGSPLPAAKVFKIVYLGVGFALLFTGFVPAQAMVSSMFSGVGFASLAVLYLLFAASSLVAPAIVDRYGPRSAMVAASVTYVVWLAASLAKSPAVFLVASGLAGFGAGLLWIGQGVYMNRVAAGQAVGRLSGIFFGLTSSSTIVGNFISAVLLRVMPVEGVLVVLMGVSLLGGIVICFARPVQRLETEQSSSLRQSLYDTFNMAVRNRKMRLLLLYIVFQGASISFAFGMLPILLELPHVPLVFTAFGVAQVLGSVCYGVLYDRFGWRPLAGFSLALPTLVYVLVVTADVQRHLGLFIFCGLLLGGIDVLTNTFISVSLMTLFAGEKNPAAAYAVWRFGLAMATAIGFFSGAAVHYVAMEVFLELLAVAAVVSLWFLYRREGAEEPKKDSK